MSKIECSCIVFHGCWKPEKTQAPLPRWCSSTSVMLPGVSESSLQQLRFRHKFTWSCCCTALQSALKETNVTKITEGKGDFFYKTSEGIHRTHSNSFSHKLYCSHSYTYMHNKHLLALDLCVSKWCVQDHRWGTRDTGS